MGGLASYRNRAAGTLGVGFGTLTIGIWTIFTTQPVICHGPTACTAATSQNIPLGTLLMIAGILLSASGAVGLARQLLAREPGPRDPAGAVSRSG
jgi:hypothetical protein